MEAERTNDLIYLIITLPTIQLHSSNFKAHFQKYLFLHLCIAATSTKQLTALLHLLLANPGTKTHADGNQGTINITSSLSWAN